MEFYAVDKFTFLSKCENYKITLANAGTRRLFSCFRANETPVNSWQNINEESSYLTFQAACFRIKHVHKSEPQKAFKPIPGANRSTDEYARDALTNIKAHL